MRETKGVNRPSSPPSYQDRLPVSVYWLGQMEVFEMATEHFACPNSMKEQLPSVYDYLMDIYQQDPSNVRTDIQSVSSNV